MKKKILALCDHALSTSGVGTQSRHLFTGLIETGNWTIRQFGAALKHADYRTIVVNDDFIIKPIDGFGNKEMLRVALATEKPDILFIFTDPRFFTWLFEMEDEIKQVCPIVWWHVWDNYPYPNFNDHMYKATDLLNCHSHMTYKMIVDKYPEKTNFVPHALPESLFFPVSHKEKNDLKKKILGENKKDHFVSIWVNRNAKRKRPNDLLMSWKIFLDKLKEKEGHQKATLIMHTDPRDHEGPNLLETAKMLRIENNVLFSCDRLDFEKMNKLYNISDCCINISLAEGFGLATLEAMMTGTPIIALKTGGLTRQVVDHRDESENGIALDVELKSLVGSQGVPYIYEDYVSVETISEALYTMCTKSEKEKMKLSKKCLDYAREEFAMQKTVELWNKTMLDKLEAFNSKDYKKWECKTL